MPLFERTTGVAAAFSLFSATASSTSASVIWIGWSLWYSSSMRFTIWPSFKPPWPSVARHAFQSWKPYLCSILLWYSGLLISERLIFFVLQYWAISSFPFTMFSSFNSLRNHWLILFFACVLFTIFNQSLLGPLEFCEVKISIRSPFWIT